MIRAVIGLDTSNYRTSFSAVSTDREIILNERTLLPVPEGDRGLRQSDAVFAHVKQLGNAAERIRNAASGLEILAVAASGSPCDGDDSYMPVFQVGTSFGRMMAALFGVPFFVTTHQRGHLAAAAFGTRLAECREMLAIHLSGGTTDMLALRNGSITRIGGSLDLHAGQLVDRTGVAMGLPFPSGSELEKLAEQGFSRGMIGCSMTDSDLFCHFSGAETQAARWIASKQMRPEDIAREIFDFLARTTARMLTAGSKSTGIQFALIAGGIASSSLFRTLLEYRLSRLRNAPQAVFGEPELSGDNAVGVALIGLHNYLKSNNLSTGG